MNEPCHADVTDPLLQRSLAKSIALRCLRNSVLHDLIPAWRRHRHSDVPVAQIAGSIRQFDFNERGVRAGGSRK